MPTIRVVNLLMCFAIWIQLVTLAMMYVAPVLTLIGVCDREPERENECLEKLKHHVSLIFRMVHADIPRENGGE